MPKKADGARERARGAAAGPGGEPRSRPPIERMVRLHELLQAGRYPNCSSAGAALEVSGKTVQRDIEFMKYRMELPIEYDRRRHGFYYAEAVSHFPVVQVSQGELVALLVAQKALEQYRGTAFEKPLRSAFAKLESSLREETGVSLGDLGEAISFRPQDVAVAELGAFQALAETVMAGEEVEFSYRALHRRTVETRRVRPYHLGCVANHWYLIGYDARRKAIRTFALPRIRRVRKLGVRFARPHDFSVARMFAGSFSAFQAGVAEEVRIALHGFAAELAAERRWHPSQKLTAGRDGCAILTMKVAIAPDLESWILSWGPHAEVLSPPSLRERIAGVATTLAARYAPAG